MSWVVTATAVGVSVPAGGIAARHLVIVEQGAPLPPGVEAEQIERLARKSMIRQNVEADVEEIADIAEKLNTALTPETTTVDIDQLDLAGLRAYAAEHGIDLGSAVRKSDIAAVIRAANS